MTDMKVLYTELKPAMEALATPLFDLSKKFLAEMGSFLPHGAVLTSTAHLELVGAQGDRELTNAAEILPLLHGGLRALAKERDLAAVGVAENVTITLPGQPATQAIKVLFEHRRGLTAALYMPYRRTNLEGVVYGATFSMLANAEVKAW
jgi:hypothetical protein